MERTARYYLIGVFTLLSILGGFAFVYWIRSVGGLTEQAIYKIRFEQPVPGLATGSNVLFNGIRAGAISRVELDPDNPKVVIATVSLDPKVPVRADTQVAITYIGFTGAPALALKGGSQQAPKLVGQNGQPPLIVAGADAGRSLTDSAQETLHQIDDILSENRKPLNTAITGIASFADMLGRNSQRVEGLIGGLETLTGSGASKQGPPIYDLSAANDFPPVEKAIKGQLVIPDPNALILFDSQKILTRTDAGTYASVNNAQWADNLPKLIQARIVQSFENARQLKSVSRPLDQLNAQYRLELTIRGFHVALEPSPHAVVDLTARLVSDKGDIASARIFTASAPAKSADAADAVAALNQAFLQVAGEIVVWATAAI